MFHVGGKVGEPGVSFTATWTFNDIGGGKAKLTMHSVFPSAEARDEVVKRYGAIEGGQTDARTAGRVPAQNVGWEDYFGLLQVKQSLIESASMFIYILAAVVSAIVILVVIVAAATLGVQHFTHRRHLRARSRGLSARQRFSQLGSLVALGQDRSQFAVNF